MCRKAISLICETEIYLTNVAIVISSTFNPIFTTNNTSSHCMPFRRECRGWEAGSIEEILVFLDVIGISRCREEYLPINLVATSSLNSRVVTGLLSEFSAFMRSLYTMHALFIAISITSKNSLK